VTEIVPTLLLVDDEERILGAMRRTLRREGYEILTAPNARDALEILGAHSVDILLSDQKMPGMSGVDLLAEVARRRPRTVRILLTGWPEDVPPALREAIGLHALIAKPWDDGVLKQTLRDALAKRPA
jgi:response regulator RpfG family c-di-GMP phosphodiesterase